MDKPLVKLPRELLSEEEINVIANDYNDLWRCRAITDKDHGQVEDLIVSHLALLTEVKRLQAIEAAILNGQEAVAVLYHGWYNHEGEPVYSGQTISSIIWDVLNHLNIKIEGVNDHE